MAVLAACLNSQPPKLDEDLYSLIRAGFELGAASWHPRAGCGLLRRDRDQPDRFELCAPRRDLDGEREQRICRLGQTTAVVIESQTFSFTRIPFETESQQGQVLTFHIATHGSPCCMPKQATAKLDEDLCSPIRLSLSSALPAGSPEPDVVFSGAIAISPTGSNDAFPGATWTVSGNSESVVSANTSLVVIESQTFYLTRIPFETRQLADNTPFPATPNTLALTPALTAYTRSATVDGRTAYLPPNAGTFSYGVTVQGQVPACSAAHPLPSAESVSRGSAPTCGGLFAGLNARVT